MCVVVAAESPKLVHFSLYRLLSYSISHLRRILQYPTVLVSNTPNSSAAKDNSAVLYKTSENKERGVNCEPPIPMTGFSSPILKVLVAATIWLSLLSAVSSFTVASPPQSSIRGVPSTKLLGEADEYSENGEASSMSISGRRRPLRRSSSSSATGGLSTQDQLETRRREAQKRHTEALKDPTLLTKVTFADRTDMSPATKRAITEVLGLQRMTEIQSKTYATALEGNNVLGRAKTGTGKTLAFLLPSIERLLEADLDLFKPGLTIGMIIVAPTRELAIQIADQAESLLTFHNDMDVACVYGGTKLQRDVRLLSGPRLPTVLVATPGRLLEHCESTRIGRRKFSDIAQETRIVVLDEADRLLEGFAKDTQRILSFLPRAEKRQTLLFSATVSKKLREFVKESMKIEFQEIDCLANRNARGETNLRVDQSYLVLKSMNDYIPTLVSIIERARKEKNDSKILVFFPASKLVRFFVHFFNIGLEIPVLEIHSRMSQASRARASNAFRSSKNTTLFSSDVSARGVDYPDVSMVVQYGAPSSEDAYIHRLGRTGRAGSSGRGLLVLLPFERQQSSRMQKRGIRVEETVLEGIVVDEQEEMARTIKSTQLRVRSGHSVLTPNAEAASKAFLAYYVGKSGLEPAGILKYADEFAQSTGLLEMPVMESKIVAKLGLEGLLKVE